ncbi:hypothetical protein B0H10DRAFT_2442377 [Mycena sp. CBHHK59/15]|nr:hypothetical protein B0H10DRAFT_2442377 [Mycena sp. CBHHK59/15]
MSSPMPINATTSSSSTVSTSLASSPSSSAGVYVPVHRRTNSASSSRSAEPTNLLPKAYTPTELMQLAQSPLTTQLSSFMHTALQAFVEIVVVRKRSREHMEVSGNTAPVVSLPAPPRLRPVGRSYNRRNVGSKIVDGSSWRLGAQMRPRLEVPGSLPMIPMAV